MVEVASVQSFALTIFVDFGPCKHVTSQRQDGISPLHVSGAKIESVLCSSLVLSRSYQRASDNDRF